ncbi:MAG: type II secretion system protein, partial [Planctomycetota bacterium]
MLSLRASSVIRTRPAFTLLELVIVLVIMVGLTAIAWPNLARQLRKSELRESAQLLRSAIEECGYRAASDGRPTFLKLVEGSGYLELISANHLAEEATKTNSATTSEYASETELGGLLASSSEASVQEASSNRSWEFSG